MKIRSRTRPALEALEQRWCPAVTARVSGGNLIVSGAATTAGDTVKVTQTAADAFLVEDGATAVGTFTGVTRDVRVNLGAADDVVVLDLGGRTTPRNVAVNLGRGDNQLTVLGGTIRGNLSVNGGGGVDAVTLGDGTTALQVNRDAAINLDGSGTDALTVSANVTLKDDLTTYFVNTVTLAAGSVVEDYVGIVGGTAGNTVLLAGEIGGGVGFTGSTNADTFTLTGTVGRNVYVGTFGGADVLNLGGTVTGHFGASTGGGNDTVTLSGTIGRSTSLFTEAGNDTVTMTATARFIGNAVIGLGSGNDSVTLDDAAAIATMLINGGSGTDTFTGTATRTGLTLVGFEP